MIFGYEPGYLICLFIVGSAWLFLLINFVRYKWINGELKTRIALQIWAIFKILHIYATYHGYRHYLFLVVSLFAILYIILRNFNRKPHAPPSNS